MRDRSGGRPIELGADPIVEGGGSDHFQRKLVYVALGEALTAPDDDPVDEEIQLRRESFRSRRDRTRVEEPLMVISPPSDSLSSGTESASSPSSSVELFQSTLVKVRDTRYFVTVFIKPTPGSSSTVWSGPGLGESLLLTRPAAARPRLHAAHDTVDGHEQIVMIFSCGDGKPSDHLGIKIPRIGLPLLAKWRSGPR
jgi:hypothetical protein